MQLVTVKIYKKATEANYKILYQNFKDIFENVNHDELIKTLADYSNEYAIIAGNKSSGNEMIDRKIAELKILEASSFYSFLLGILHLRKEEKLTDNDVLEILDAIFVYVARRRILKLTEGENKNIPLLAKYFENIIQSTDKRKEMFVLLSDQAYFLRLPNDNEIRNSLLSENPEEANFYNLKSSKFLLSLIEEAITKNRPDLKDKVLQVEHILPQKLNEEWKQILGDNWEEIYITNI